ncbi:MAG: diphthine--ammonia ligase [Clostridia bacterium]|nr:diphthine--ammonia ligase [Clostridia bacterium]
MKFIMSYSCGKDSTLALHKMLAAGHEPAALVVMFNESAGRSFFHGADRPMLEAYGRALGLPVRPVPTAGETYHLAMETALVRITRETGAEAVCFGDIDIQANRDWCEARARAAGLKPFFPLWQRDRRENVREVMDLGYRCIIKSIHNTLLPRSLLGRVLDGDATAEMARHGIDICGENGEYHTLAVDGPIFRQPLPFVLGKVLDFGEYSVIEVDVR